MNTRIKHLREQSLKARPALSCERARLITEFYQTGLPERVSAPVARAMAFRYLLENKALCINPGEWIVGERGPAPKATPTYPEICIHSLEDLDILHQREKISFHVEEETRKFYRDVCIPFWKDRSIRDRLFAEMNPEWKAAYEAGVFTEFMEQRAPGHTVLDGKIYSTGMKDFLRKIETAMNRLDFERDDRARDRMEELKAMAIAARALVHFASRYAEEARRLARESRDPEKKKILKTVADVCSRVPENAPRTFLEALQYYWFVHLGVITELNTWDSFNPGRLDQHLYPFYSREIESGKLTPEQAREYLQSFWIKFNNQPAPPKVGVTAQESNTYTDFCLINLGGVTPDGRDGVNDLTFLILDVIEEMRLLQPSSMVQVSRKNTDRILHRALKIIRTGFGQPSIFNTDAIIQELLRQGKTLKDARSGGASGCVETGAFGKESYILTGYFNIPKVLEITLNNGVDPRTGRCIGLKTGDPAALKTFEALYEAFDTQFRHFIDIKIRGNRIIERIWASYLPAPFMSILVDDCIEKGRDYNDGGARYNTSYIQCVGMGSITDSLSAIQHHVYSRGSVSMERLLAALRDDFEGHEDLLAKLIQETPKYGNDDDRADDILRRVFETCFSAVDGRPNTKGGVHRINLLPTTVHVYFGSVLGAMPDGRRAGKPLSEGISPVQGADVNGPTSVIKSAARIDHLRTGGTLLNQKFTPQLLADDQGIEKLAQLIRAYFRMDGHHIQFNVVTAGQLRQAQKNPDQYRDLIVRVAGYSDYFVDLGEDLQNEIIERTEHMELL
ncbi:MAG TPA: glycyl radical protein [bacterium]|nr:glycyl radical protein [bacterium]